MGGEDTIDFSVDVRIGDSSFQCNSEWYCRRAGDIGKVTITFGPNRKKFLSSSYDGDHNVYENVENFKEVRSITNASSPKVLGRLMNVLQLDIGRFEDNYLCQLSWEELDYFP